MKFIDEATITVSAGHGGKGCVSFRREAHEPRGGPDGGNGGKGGDVLLQTDPGLGTLLDFRYKRHFEAKRGGHGQGANRYGRGGEDTVIRVPVGTMVKDAKTGDLLVDLAKPGQSYLAAKGGRGGRGNLSYLSSTNRAPRQVQPGEAGEERQLKLELKLLADVALVGRPNAGKSTLLSRISAARPKIAAYPFTTLQPQLGVVQVGDAPAFTVADIPGLIEGAHQGAGMGIRFLKHIERTRLFLHLIDLSDLEFSDPWAGFVQVESELAAYSLHFKKRPRWVLFTKIDLLQSPQALKKAERRFAAKKIKTFAVSALTGLGMEKLLQALAKAVSKNKKEEDSLA
ncbi:MAG TPA: GTPase ObgE [Deltaproteobacteria bacterium]|nr:GTPase ObgE [Deltaproteobacteria bacterium]